MKLILRLQKQSNNGGGYFFFHIPIRDFKKSPLEPDKHYLLNLKKVEGDTSCRGTFRLKEKMIKKYPYHFFHIPSRLFRKLQLEADQHYIVDIQKIKGFETPKKSNQEQLNTPNVGGGKASNNKTGVKPK